MSEKIREMRKLDNVSQGAPLKLQIINFITLKSRNFIPISEPIFVGNEAKYLADCIDTGWISSTGKYIGLFENKFKNYTYSKYALAVSNGTVAIKLALKSLSIGTGDEVIVPNLTFAATINAVIDAGATPKLVDVNPLNYNIDSKKIEKKISKNTKAIIVVHLFGYPCDMTNIIKLTKKYNLKLIEDCAEALGSKFNKRHVGNFGDAGTFSFFGNKLITTGEGGMIVFKNKNIYLKAKILRDHGMDPKKRYWHIYPGYNYRMTNLQASIGLAQMENINFILKNRIKSAMRYLNNLNKYKYLIQMPFTSKKYHNSFWAFALNIKHLKFNEIKEKLLKQLNLIGVEARDIFYPLSKMKVYKKYTLKKERYHFSEGVSSRSLTLPLSSKISDNEIDYICKNVISILDQYNEK